jgi:cytochrome o ubiquinol oxidase subunit 2
MLGPVPPISRIDAKRVVPEGTKPLVVEVVALNWKWLFIYRTRYCAGQRAGRTD